MRIAAEMLCMDQDELEAGAVCRLADMDEGGSSKRGLSYSCCGTNARDYDCRSRQWSDG